MIYTISTNSANKIKMPSRGNKSATMLSIIAGRSLYVSEPNGCFVSFSKYSDESIKDVYLSDESGLKLPLSNLITFNKSQYIIK